MDISAASDFCDLVAGIDPAYLCEYLHITLRTLNRWKTGTARPPYSALVALRIKLDGDLSAIAGDAWKGFRIGQDGKLYAPFFHRGHAPRQICAMFFELQELRFLRREVQRLNAALDVQKSRAWALQKLQQVTSG